MSDPERSHVPIAQPKLQNCAEPDIRFFKTLFNLPTTLLIITLFPFSELILVLSP